MHPQATVRISEESDWVQPSVLCDVPQWASQELIDATLKVWQPYYSDPLTEEDAKYIILSVGRLIDAVGDHASGPDSEFP